MGTTSGGGLHQKGGTACWEGRGRGGEQEMARRTRTRIRWCPKSNTHVISSLHPRQMPLGGVPVSSQISNDIPVTEHRSALTLKLFRASFSARYKYTGTSNHVLALVSTQPMYISLPQVLMTTVAAHQFAICFIPLHGHHV